MVIKDDRTALKEQLEEMTLLQQGQFLTITAARGMARFSNSFFQDENALRFLNTLCLALNHCCFALFNITDINVFRPYRFGFFSTIVDALDRNVPNLTIYDQTLVKTHRRIFQEIINCICIINLGESRNAPDLFAFDLVWNLHYSYDDRHTLLADAQKVSQNLTHIPGAFRSCATNNLNKIGAKYWADWYEELFDSGFRLSDTRLKEFLSLNEKHVDLTIAQTSTFLLAQREGTTLFNEARLILLGDKGSGKTTFAKRFQKLNAKMPKLKESTPGVDFHHIKASAICPKYAGERDYTIHIWDFAGHAVTHAAHKFFLSDRAVYVIVLRGRTENGTPINEWLEHITYYAGSSAEEKIKVYILINQTDENVPQVEYDPKYDEKFDIEKKQVINLRKDKKPGGPLDRLRKSIVGHIVSSPQNRNIPTSIFDIKKEIEAEFAEDSNASKDKIVEIIQKHTYFPPDDILHILHSYGICFYYDELKSGDDKKLQADAVVLNPRWVTYAIYRLINFIQNDMKTNKDRSDGHIKIEEFQMAFTNTNISPDSYQKHASKLYIPPHRHQFLSMLAQTFGLAYEKNNYLIFPNCLPENYPKKERGLGDPASSDFFVKIITSTERSNTSPVTFPKDIIPAFIVKRHMNLVDNETYCSRNGIVLKHPKTSTKAEVKKTSEYQINVLVKGCQQASCEFGADLIGDLYNVIQKYRVFQDEQKRPAIKISFVDKDGKDRSCEIAELLKEDSWIDTLVEPSKLSPLKRLANEIDQRLTLRFSAPVGKASVEAELGPKAPDE